MKGWRRLVQSITFNFLLQGDPFDFCRILMAFLPFLLFAIREGTQFRLILSTSLILSSLGSDLKIWIWWLLIIRMAEHSKPPSPADALVLNQLRLVTAFELHILNLLVRVSLQSGSICPTAMLSEVPVSQINIKGGQVSGS